MNYAPCVRPRPSRNAGGAARIAIAGAMRKAGRCAARERRTRPEPGTFPARMAAALRRSRMTAAIFAAAASLIARVEASLSSASRRTRRGRRAKPREGGKKEQARQGAPAHAKECGRSVRRKPVVASGHWLRRHAASTSCGARRDVSRAWRVRRAAKLARAKLARETGSSAGNAITTPARPASSKAGRARIGAEATARGRSDKGSDRRTRNSDPATSVTSAQSPAMVAPRGSTGPRNSASPTPRPGRGSARAGKQEPLAAGAAAISSRVGLGRIVDAQEVSVEGRPRGADPTGHLANLLADTLRRSHPR